MLWLGGGADLWLAAGFGPEEEARGAGRFDWELTGCGDGVPLRLVTVGRVAPPGGLPAAGGPP